MTSAERIAPSASPPRIPNDGDEQRAQPQVRADRRRRRALRLEVEQLAAVVAHVADDREQQADEREQQRDRRGAGEREQRAARERVGLQPRERVGARLHGELRDGGRRALFSQSSSVVPSPGERVSSGVAAADAVGDHRVADDRREALERRRRCAPRPARPRPAAG